MPPTVNMHTISNAESQPKPNRLQIIPQRTHSHTHAPPTTKKTVNHKTAASQSVQKTHTSALKVATFLISTPPRPIARTRAFQELFIWNDASGAVACRVRTASPEKCISCASSHRRACQPSPVQLSQPANQPVGSVSSALRDALAQCVRVINISLGWRSVAWVRRSAWNAEVLCVCDRVAIIISSIRLDLASPRLCLCRPNNVAPLRHSPEEVGCDPEWVHRFRTSAAAAVIKDLDLGAIRSGRSDSRIRLIESIYCDHIYIRWSPICLTRLCLYRSQNRLSPDIVWKWSNVIRSGRISCDHPVQKLLAIDRNRFLTGAQSL